MSEDEVTAEDVGTVDRQTGQLPDAGRPPSKRRAGKARGKGGLSAGAIADRTRRDDLAYALKLAGEHSLQRIADYPDPAYTDGRTLYNSKQAADDGWRRAAERHAVGDLSIQERRDLAEQRLETLLRAVWPDAVSRKRGYLFAVDRALQITRDYRELLALDLPKRVDVSLTVDTDFDRAFRELQAEIAATAVEQPVEPRQIEQ